MSSLIIYQYLSSEEFQELNSLGKHVRLRQGCYSFLQEIFLRPVEALLL